MNEDSILYETHMHTPLCGHAEGEPEEYAARARERGLRGIIVTCHNPLPDALHSPTIRMHQRQFDDYVRLVERARARYEGEVDVRLGLECDWLPDLGGFLEQQLASAPFQYVLGSVHPQLPPYRERFFDGDPVAYQRSYFRHLAEAAESGLFDCLSHPDLVKNCFPDDWQLERVWDEVEGALDRIAASGTAMELNTSGLHKSISEFNPNPRQLVAMRERRIPVVVGADAHVPWRVAADYETAYDALEAAGYETVALFLDRERRDIPIAAARASLK